jgi:probable rRNA maturation factor
MMRAATSQVSVIEVDIIVECDRWPSDAQAIVRRALAQAAQVLEVQVLEAQVLEAQVLQKDSGRKDLGGRALAVLLTDDAAVRRLNATWRGLDRPTNVLSFPAPLNDPNGALGDIAIAFETTAREATAEHKPLAHHLSHLALHGFLHLLGYDHESDAQAEEMEALERKVLEVLGVPDPYAIERLSEDARV